MKANQTGEAKTIEIISVKEARALCAKDANVKFLDVRAQSEYDDVHIKDAVHVPINAIDSKIPELSRPNKCYITVCRTGNRAFMAADMMMHAGISAVKVMEGGMLRWQREKLPVIKGPGVISLERQVRIGAGLMVLAGVALAFFVHIGFIFISAFVGCGLIYAGITDSCMMGVLLMKLPYNKRMLKPKTGGGT